MRKRILPLAIAMSAIVTLTGITTMADDNAALKEKNAKDQERIENLNKEVDQKNTEIDSAKKEVNVISQKISDLSQQIADGETKLLKLKKDIRENTEELEKNQAEEVKIRKEMKLRIQYMYENANTNLLVLMFQEENLTDFLNSAEYKSKITSYDREQVEQYAALIEKIKQRKERNETLLSEQTAIQNELTDHRSKSKELLKEHEALIAKNEHLIDDMSSEISELKETISKRESQIKDNIAAAQAKLEEAKRAAAAAQAAPAAPVNSGTNGGGSAAPVAPPTTVKPSGSGYVWPLPPNQTTISSPFDPNRRLVWADYINGGHIGADISAPTGTPVYAAKGGVVVWSAFSSDAGNMVCIIQDDGFISRYMHMSARSVSNGQVVSQGQQIGAVGATGLATGPHLHFQIESDPNAPWGSTAFDPLSLY
ncbi:MAG: peptidoglycan DD-metalloendopeptidase family protein [Eubacteriales bacterium]|nr:peptidoglycan DD-metalloendopeptidase family protein [Eubacteriales bacterium]